MSPAPRSFNYEEAVVLFAEGLSYQAIAERLGATKGAVEQALRPRGAQPFNGRTRAEDGVIVTATVNGRTVVRHEPAPPLQALRRIITALEAKGEVRIVCISSPATIWRDLQGVRLKLTASDSGSGFGSKDGTRAPGSVTASPEQSLLGQIGRLDLLP